MKETEYKQTQQDLVDVCTSLMSSGMNMDEFLEHLDAETNGKLLKDRETLAKLRSVAVAMKALLHAAAELKTHSLKVWLMP